jgi:uncharacterized membrane protein
MPSSYNDVAGRSLERLAALSDGIFAVAMTLLVLDLRVPVQDALHPFTTEAQFWNAMMPLNGTFLAYFMSFITLGIFWLGQQTEFNVMARSDRNLAWIHIAFLMMIALMPGSTALLAAFMGFRIALIGYWLNILILGLLLLWAWQYAKSAGLLKDDVPPAMDAAVRRRIWGAQALYAFGAALCIFNTYWSIEFMVLVQLNFAIAPRVRWLRNL